MVEEATQVFPDAMYEEASYETTSDLLRSIEQLNQTVSGQDQQFHIESTMEPYNRITGNQVNDSTEVSTHKGLIYMSDGELFNFQEYTE